MLPNPNNAQQAANIQPAGHNDQAPFQEWVSNVPEAEYKVGPRCPPKQFQWQKGKSGNPKGAKRKAPSMLPDLKKIIEQALSQKIKVTQGGRQRTLTMFEVGIEKLVQQFAKGDRHARKDFFELAEQVDLDLRCSEPIPRIDREPAWHEIARQFTDDQILMLIKAERIKERVIARTQPCQDRPVSVQSTKPVQNPALRH